MIQIWHYIPQILLTGLIVLGAGVSIGRCGEPKTDTYNWVDCFGGPLLVLFLLYAGGFYG